MMKSNVKLGDARENRNPLVGAFAGKLTFSGIWPLEVAPVGGVPTTTGGAGEWKRGLAWVAMGLPPKKLAEVAVAFTPAMPNCIPISRANVRQASSTRAGISTCQAF